MRSIERWWAHRIGRPDVGGLIFQEHPVVVPQVMHPTRGFYGALVVHIGAGLYDHRVSVRAMCDPLDYGTLTRDGHWHGELVACRGASF